LRPILKWAGGKRSLTREIINLFPEDFKSRSYHEPFFGGGAVFFKIQPKKGSINDINEKLINFYKVVREHPHELIQETKQHPYCKDTYYDLREKFNSGKLDDIEAAALFLYLNKTAYNGLYRVNSDGKFNVPFGRHKNPTITPEKIILQASKLLKNVEILNQDFNYIAGYAEKGDIVYLDPPYQPISETSKFTSYTKEGFGLKKHRNLRNLCFALDRSGVLFVLSNSFSKQIEDLYADSSFKINWVSSERKISSKSSSRGRVKEMLVTNIHLN
jgi:DNA adenine methylase